MDSTKWADVAHYYSKSEIFIQTEDVGIREMLGVRGTRGVMYATRAHAMHSRWSQHKPILRHRDDMTEAEAKELFSQSRPSPFDETIFSVSYGNELNYYRSNHFSLPFNRSVWRAIEFLWLISKGFDMFGLIESGQAIRKGVDNG